MPSEAAIRVSDAERESVVTALAEHHAAGRLSLGEFEERVDVAYRAVTRADLDAVLSDLPRHPEVRPRSASTCEGWGGSWAAWVTTAVICLVVWVTSSIASREVLYFWPMWVIGPWGLAVVARRFGSHSATTRG